MSQVSADNNSRAMQVQDAFHDSQPQSRRLVCSFSEIWDAGTEENTELGAVFLAVGGDSTDESGLVTQHPGFNMPGNILGGLTAAGTTVDEVLGDFTQSGYQLARISINQIPEPRFMAMTP